MSHAPLTNAIISALRPKDRRYKRFDTGGLYIEVLPTGARSWRFRYTRDGVPIVLTFGTWPDTTLVEARRKRDEAIALRDEDVDPRSEKRRTDAAAAGAGTGRQFETEAREWLELKRAGWSEQYAGQMTRILERDIFPIIGKRRCPDITAPDVLDVIQRIEERGALEVAADARSTLEQIFQRARSLGRCTNNPAADIRGQLKKRERTNFASLPAKDLPTFFALLRASRTDELTKLGLKAVIYTALRSTEVRELRWSEVDFHNALITIPAARMKNGAHGVGPHLVPLSAPAIKVFRELHKLTGRREWVFPHRIELNAPISDGTWLVALKRMGYANRATVHGFRTTFSTAANEAHVTVPHVPVPVKLWDKDWIERQLDHCEVNKVRKVYNRAEYMEPRRALMSWWGDYVAAAEAGHVPGAAAPELEPPKLKRGGKKYGRVASRTPRAAAA